MEPKDWIAILVSCLAVAVSIGTAVLSQRAQKRSERRQQQWRQVDSKLSVEQEFMGVQHSMQYIGLRHWQQQRAGSNLWCLAYYGLPAVPGDMLSDEQQKQQLENLLELGDHQRAVDTFWDRVMTRHVKDELPSNFFKRDGGWIMRANNYRLMSEPLYIANHYRSRFDKDGAYMLQDDRGTWVAGKKRPARYAYYERLWEKLKGSVPEPSTAWAVEFERQLQECMAVTHKSRLDAPIRDTIDLSHINSEPGPERLEADIDLVTGPVAGSGSVAPACAVSPPAPGITAASVAGAAGLESLRSQSKQSGLQSVVVDQPDETRPSHVG